MSQPLVSVCCIAYNQQRYLSWLFEAVIAQTYPNIEFIFVDDHSPDDSWIVVESYRKRLEARFPRCVLVRNDKNLGGGPTCDKATSLATGEYINILEGDDFYLPEQIAENVKFLEHNPDHAAVHSDFVELKDTGSIVEAYWKAKGRIEDDLFWEIPSGFVRDDLLKANFVLTATTTWRTSAFRENFNWDHGFTINDYACILRLSQKAKIGYVNRPLSVYRRLANSASNDPAKRQRLAEETQRIRAAAIAGTL